MIHVCSLRLLEEMVRRHRPSHIVTLINADMMPDTPQGIARNYHLKLSMNDIHQPRDGLVPPEEAHVVKLIEFVTDWDRSAPVLIHCWAGVSRSTAAAYVTLCTLNPAADEDKIARMLRAASPIATPNRRIVAIADTLLKREGRMVEAIADIGRGRTAMEGDPFGISATIS